MFFSRVLGRARNIIIRSKGANASGDDADSDTDGMSSGSHESWCDRICTSLRRNTLEELDIDYGDGYFDEVVLSEITEAVRECRSLEHLVLRNLETRTPCQAKSLLIPSVTSLRLEDSGEEAILYIAGLLTKKRTSITSLFLKGNVVCPKGARALGNMLRENESIKHLGFCHNGINEECLEMIARGLRHNLTVVSLDLVGNQINDSSLSRLCHALQYNSSITYLCLDFNRFTHVGVASIGSMLKTNNTMRELHLFGNRIDSRGAEALASALAQNSGLKSLVLSFNQIGNHGLVVLGEALLLNSTLTKLWFPTNFVNSHGLIPFANMLPQMKGLEEIFVGDVLDVDVTEAFLEGLKCNTNLRHLHMDSPMCDTDDYTQDHIDFYLTLNRSGRRLLESSKFVPNSLWPCVLAKVRGEKDKASDPAILYALLRERPDLFAGRS